jgi:hypothetical protein
MPATLLSLIHLRADSTKVAGETKDWIGEAYSDGTLVVKFGRTGAKLGGKPKVLEPSRVVQVLQSKADQKRREGYWQVAAQTEPPPAPTPPARPLKVTPPKDGPNRLGPPGAGSAVTAPAHTTEDLVLAASKGQRLRVRQLLDNGVGVNTVGRLGRTALHAASVSVEWTVVALLLAAGAHPDASDTRGERPLHNAAWRNRLHNATFSARTDPHPEKRMEPAARRLWAEAQARAATLR